MKDTLLRKRMLELPIVTGKDVWDERRRQVRHHVEKGDKPDELFEWSTIRATCVAGKTPATVEMRRELEKNGIDVDFEGEDRWNLMRQRHHLWSFEKENPDIDVKQLNSIVEFGGGYGAMAVVLSELGYQGTYYIYDFPEMQLIQRYHTERMKVKCKMRYGKIKYPDLFISCYGLSEAPIWDRDEFLDDFHPKHFLIIAQSTWGKIDNAEYITNWANSAGYDWLQEGAVFVSCQK